MIYLERHVDDDNLHRFYAMALSQDLFGAWILERRWGRVGSPRGRKLAESFKTEEDAEAARDILGVQKRKRGYERVPSGTAEGRKFPSVIGWGSGAQVTHSSEN